MQRFRYFLVLMGDCARAAIGFVWGVWALCGPARVWGQVLDPEVPLARHQVKSFTKVDGFGISAIETIHVDRKGFVWIGTFEGLFRHDGQRFDLYNQLNTPAFRTNAVTSIAEDDQGVLWIGTNGGGLIRFDGERFTNYSARDSSSNLNSIHRILLHPTLGLVYSSRGAGMGRLVEGRLEPYAFQTNDYFTFYIEGLAVYPDGRLLLASDKGIYEETAPHTLRQVQYRPGRGPEVTHSVHVIGDTAWLCTLSGLYFKTGNAVGQIALPSVNDQGSVDGGVRYVVQDTATGALYIGTYSAGLFRMYKGKLSNRPVSERAQMRYMKTMVFDQEGNLWVGTYRSGLFRISSSKVTNLRPQGFGNETSVMSLLENPDGTFWMGTANDGLFRLGPEGKILQHLTEAGGLPGNQVRTLCQGPSGQVFIGTYGGGLGVLRGNRLVAPPFRLPPAFHSIRCLRMGPDGHLYVGSASGGLARVNLAQNTWQVLDSVPGQRRLSVISMEWDSEGRLWMGTDGTGILITEGVRIVRHLTTEENLNHPVILTLYYDRVRKAMLIGSNGGLQVYRGGQFTDCRPLGDVFKKPVQHITADRQGNYWWMSNDGWVQVVQEDLYRAFEAPGGNLRSFVYDERDGMASASGTAAGYPMAQVLSDGRVTSCHRLGVCLIDPAGIPRNRLPPRVYFPVLRIDGVYQSISGTEVTLAPGTGSVELTYSGIAYQGAEKLQFRVRVPELGIDLTRPSNDRTLFLSTLEPGRYQVQVSARSADGIWSEVPTKLTVVQKPYFRQTWVFYLLVSVGFAGVLYGAYSYRTLQLRRWTRELAETVAAKTRDLRAANRELATSHDRINLLADLGISITSQLSEKGIERAVYSGLKKLVGAEYFTIGVYEPEQDRLRFWFSREKDGERGLFYESLKPGEKQRLTGWCMRHQSPVLIGNLPEEIGEYLPNYPMAEVEAESGIPLSVAYVPIITGGERIGVLGTWDFVPNAFTTYHIGLLESLAVYIGTALVNLRTVQTLDQQRAEMAQQADNLATALTTLRSYQEQLERLTEVGLEITTRLTEEDMARNAFEKLRGYIPWQFCSIGILDDERTIRSYYERFDKREYQNRTFDVYDTSNIYMLLVRRLLETGRSVVISDSRVDIDRLFPDHTLPRDSGLFRSPHSFLASPLQLETTRGLLGIQTRGENVYQDNHRLILENLSLYIATALQNARAFTEIQRQQATLRRQADELTHTNEELASALKHLQDTQLQLVQSEKMASLGQLTAGIAHEINNPINFVQANIGPLEQLIQELVQLVERVGQWVDPAHRADYDALLAKTHYTDLLEDIQLLVKGIHTGAKRTSEIVRGLRAFSRVDENVVKPTDLAESVNSTLLLLQNQYKDRIQIVREFDERVPLVPCYSGQINQVLMNLLTNAMQAIEGQGTIWIRLLPEGADWVRIEIEDNGPGIPEAIREKIFDPFFTTKPTGKGTGLGLSISYTILERHRGTISLSSEVGKGTTFTLRLPVQAQVASQTEPAQATFMR